MAQLRAELRQLSPVVRAAATPQSFVADLPALDQAPQFIEALHRQAARAGLQIERAEYRSPTLAAGLVMRSQLVLPLTGRYPDIARWLDQLLRQHPSVAIDELSLQRDTGEGDQVRARVVVSHYSRVAP
jgi:Tfp pilus assembly protein PilO